MNSISKRSGLLAAAVFGLGVAGCDSIKDVRSQPSTAVPPQQGVLEGTITGLGVKRALYLDSGIELEGHQKERPFFGNQEIATVPFSYGSVPVGTPYNFTVRTQPFAKICSVANASGVVGNGAPGPAVTCVDDPSVPRVTISGTTNTTVANLPGATAVLTTEEGIERIALNGSTAFTFTQTAYNAPIINPSNPAQSQFLWDVTAEYTDNGRTYNCRVANGTGNNPTANITNVVIQACSFPVTGTVQYSAPPGGAAQAMGAGGVELALRQLGTAVPESPPVTITAFAGTTAAPTTIWPTMLSYSGAAYDIVVSRNPAGQTCIVRTFAPSITAPVLGGGLTAVTGSMQGSTLWMSAPPTSAASSSHTWNPAGVGVRCRNNPAPQNVLTGVYQRIVKNEPTPPAVPAITTRQYLALFADGTFLFASHGNAASHVSTGVEHGFYAYNPVAGTLDFSLYTDSSILGGTSATPFSLSNTPGFTGTVSADAGGLARATNVVKGAGTLSLSFTGTVAGSTVTSQWAMTEPKWTAGQMAGAWVPESDNRRLWVFNFDDTTGIHAGVNGPANLQDGCFVFDDKAAPSGYYTRRGGSTGCMTTTAGYASGFSTIDNAGRLSAVYPAGFFGRFPGTQSAADGRPPSPNLFEIVPGVRETLVVQRTVNGVPADEPQRFVRAVIN